MNQTFNYLEGLLVKNLIRCPLMDGFMNAMSVNLASKKIFIMNSSKLGDAQEATSTAQEAIQKTCSKCILRDIHNAKPDAFPPFESKEQVSGQYEPTIIIQAM